MRISLVVDMNNMEMNMVGVLERQSSIDSEPRTLNNNQIDFAREAALYVMHTRSIQEALTIFTEGLEPVVRCGGDGGGNGVGNSKSPQIYENFDHHNVRDIVSAPF